MTPGELAFEEYEGDYFSFRESVLLARSCEVAIGIIRPELERLEGVLVATVDRMQELHELLVSFCALGEQAAMRAARGSR